MSFSFTNIIVSINAYKPYLCKCLCICVHNVCKSAYHVDSYLYYVWRIKCRCKQMNGGRELEWREIINKKKGSIGLKVIFRRDVDFCYNSHYSDQRHFFSLENDSLCLCLHDDVFLFAAKWMINLDGMGWSFCLILSNVTYLSHTHGCWIFC